MIGLLRYAYLKSIRDGSLATFLLGPLVLIVASLIGATSWWGFRYPFFLDVERGAVENAALAGQIALGMSVFFAGVAAFWTFRAEVATKTIGTFILAARPLNIALALVVFGVAAGLAAWAGALGAIAALTTALPPHLGSLAVTAAIACLAVAAAGALLVMISPQPQMIIWSYCSGCLVVPVIVKLTGAMQLLVPLLASILFAGLSAILLKRRCAT